jgi:hypothetical protein
MPTPGSRGAVVVRIAPKNKDKRKKKQNILTLRGFSITFFTKRVSLDRILNMVIFQVVAILLVIW